MTSHKAALARYAWVAFWLANILLLGGLWVVNRWDEVERGGGAALIALGAICGLVGGYLLLTQLILISGLPVIERAFGLDRLANIHRQNGRFAYLFIMAHASLIVIGYSELTGRGLLSQYSQLRDGLPYILLASIAIILLNVVVISSVYIIRNNVRYEWWRVLHILAYGVVLLAFLHQINNGHEFQKYDLLRYWWWVLYIATFTAVIYMRYLRPVLLYRKFRFTVDRVEKQAKDVISIYVTGQNLENFKYRAGQFNFWHFWQTGARFQKHPFTISSSPKDKLLRLSGKAIGDFTAKLPSLEPGTKVLINGPFGRFGMLQSSGKPRLFIAGGIGITPIRSILAEQSKQSDVLLYCARTIEDLAFKKEFDASAGRGLKVNYILSEQKGLRGNFFSGYLDGELLNQLVPDAANRDVWLCGPPVMMDKVEKSLRKFGVPKRQIHTERFRL